MPASSYSQYQDPETGQIIWIPQLYPFCSGTGIISSEELETWVKAGVIPHDLYEIYVKALQEKEEFYGKCQRGESFSPQDLESKFSTFPLTDYLLKNKARIHGENVLIKIFARLENNDPDIVWLSFIKEALVTIATEDPSAIHFYTARKILKEKFDIEDSRAVDILARELLNHCQKMSNFKIFKHPVFKKNPIGLEDLNDHLKNQKKGMLELDAEFIDFLKNIGSKGKKLSEQIAKTCKELYKFYELNNYQEIYRSDIWGLWIPQDNNPINSALFLLGQALWEDRGINLWNRKTTGNPSLAKPIIDRIIPILGPQKSKKFIEEEGKIVCYSQKGEPLLMAPAVDKNMISAFQNGVKELGSLTGHKLLRWQVNTGFEKWLSDDKDPRLIEIDGGFSKIAELIGCRSTHDIARIKEILDVQAHGRFIFPDGSQGNMITLRIDERYKNQEPSKIRLVLGDMLLPGYVCQLQGNERRLIPIGNLPPLYGSANSHASQAQLQLLVFAEFSNQSDRLAKSGSVLIPIDKWKQMASEAGLNPQKVEFVITHWSQPDLFNSFLDRQGDEYRLASPHERAQRFLEYQGERRINNSEKGKRSAEIRKQKRGKNFKVAEPH